MGVWEIYDFSVGDAGSCGVLMAVLFETNEDRQIVAERVCYDADPLIACGRAARPGEHPGPVPGEEQPIDVTEQRRQPPD